MGTYYTASVARFARNSTNINAAAEDQNVHTYSIALASPLPRIEFPVGGNTVTLVPFAKTVSGTFGEATRKPTNTIVDFYVQEYENFPGQTINATVNGGRPRAVFRINYEDVEQGNDHDMDAIVRYEIIANAGNTLTVNLTSEYAAGSANQNMGYVISGTTRDGAYLEVRDRDNGNQASSAYELNTPSGNPIRWAGGCVGQMGSAPCNQGLGFTSTREFSPSANASAIQLRDPLWYAAKYGAPDPANWDTSAPGTPGAGDPDNYFLVTNPLNLRNQLSKAFDDIASRDVVAGSRTLNGARVGAESFTLQPTFQRERDGKDWTGNLSALAINPNGSIGATLWNAQSNLPLPAARNIVTLLSPGNGTSAVAADRRVPFVADELGATEADQAGAIGLFDADIDNGHYGTSRDTSAEDVVAYLRGDRSNESAGGSTANLRERGSVIGSIINSEPVVSSPRADLGYGMHDDPMFSGYVAAGGSEGYLDLKATRTTTAFVGANDGMLHGFNASTVPCAIPSERLPCAATGAGVEQFAYVPNAVLRNMALLAKTDEFYDHRYYVDGQISIGDVKVGTGGAQDWRTILVGSTGAGARSVFALDVSSPSSMDETSIRWERNSSVDNDIGHVYGKPLIVPLENGSWGVLFGNGYGGNLNDPSLYVLDAYTGAVVRKLTANDGNSGAAATNPVTAWLCQVASGFELVANFCAQRAAPFNGLGQITAIDKSGNGKVDTIYGGDLQGNLWKFDLGSTLAADWGVANAGEPLFEARIDSEPQPITGGIRVAAGPGTGVMVYFGTGRYLFERGSQPGDNDVPEDPSVQSLYAVFDNGTAVSSDLEDGGRDALQAQTITGTGAGDNGEVIRSISRTRVAYSGSSSKRGWYLDLQVYDDSGDEPGFRPIGERFIATPRIQSGRVFFTTFTPSEDSCNPGGDNFVYGLDLLSGSGALANVQVQPSEDPACTGADCGGIQIDGGGAPVTSNSVAAITTDTVINNPDGSVCDPATGDCPTFEECQVVVYPGAFVLPRPCGRQSWRQIK
ncbi:pilus assembly protein [Luteimonas cellulosilyticus]|nr:PilC/PilY family type IV pilus protein [Luteimonas cellulosilyticus]